MITPPDLNDVARLLPGVSYETWLKRFHQRLVPASYMEIGVNQGVSIVHAEWPTVCVGVDPAARLTIAPSTVTKIFPLTSDEYFRTRDVLRDCEAEHVALTFIDGLHIFEQALRDFINIERLAGPGSVVLLHDTLPFHPAVAGREMYLPFWTGDVWHVVCALKEARPDLDVVTIETPPSGLTMVTRLDRSSTVLHDNFADIVTRHLEMHLPAEWDERRALVNAVPNDWQPIGERLKSRGDPPHQSKGGGSK